MPALHVLYESALGYALFDVAEAEEIGIEIDSVQDAAQDLAKFGKICKLKAMMPFRSAQDALENINCVSDGVLPDLLKDFLEQQLPKVKSKKKASFQLGVGDSKLGVSIGEGLNFACSHTGVVPELLRGIRRHFTKMHKSIKDVSMDRAQLGLGHSYSRAKVKFNVHRVDNMIIQAICLLDQIDKDINTFAMRIREWYSYHFPELVRIVNDNTAFARLAKLIGRRTSLNADSMEMLEEVVMDTAKAQQIIEASKTSMGMDISDIDLLNCRMFADRVVSLATYRSKLSSYLGDKMKACAPNLSSLVGDQVGARLISHAGSLTNLAKAPASTVQILGAEKALFRALKTKGNTPKYGLIFHSTFISRASSKNKGRISRYLANKCSIASRIDAFADEPTSKFGLELREQVEERLRFYDSGEAPRKNIDVMQSIIKSMASEEAPRAEKRKAGGAEETDKPKKAKKEKKEKKEKKAKKEKK